MGDEEDKALRNRSARSSSMLYQTRLLQLAPRMRSLTPAELPVPSRKCVRMSWCSPGVGGAARGDCFSDTSIARTDFLMADGKRLPTLAVPGSSRSVATSPGG